VEEDTMALKGVVEDVGTLPEVVREHYTKGEDGKFYAQVEGYLPKAGVEQKLNEFRTNNHQLQDKVKEYETRFQGIDPEKYKQALAEVDQFRNGKGETFEQVINARTGQMKAEYEDRLTKSSTKQKELEKQAKEYERQLHRVLVDNELQKVAAEAKVLPTALDDILLRGRSTFRVLDGKVTPVDEQGKVIYGADVVNPMSMAEWIKGLQQKAPHLFEGATGGGATGSRGSGGAGAITITQEQARDFATYRAAKERAQKAGVPLQVIG
jgi:uncharacterized protein YeeX (DUF496 family)